MSVTATVVIMAKMMKSRNKKTGAKKKKLK
jgi:hypothetical protein